MRIGLDVMGGDFAPEVTIQGAVIATQELSSDIRIVLLGNQYIIEQGLKNAGADSSRYDIIHTEEEIAMGDNPFKAFTQKHDSSIVKGYKLLKSGQIDGFTSAGNTGAMLIGAMQVVKSVPGVIRPCIAVSIPNKTDIPTIMVDAGINPDCRPDVLYQYAILGSLYAEYIYGTDKPRIGLLNIGSEEEKGNLLVKSTFQSMLGTTDFNFVGNIEGNDVFDSDKAQVIVCDGFVGNVVLKMIEAFYSLLKIQNVHNPFFDKFNPEIYGGIPILGINAPVIIGHGNSTPIAIKNMILQVKEVIDVNLCDKIKQAFNND
ncbi:MAG: phosphate acyltransferase PlsX [Bacteroidales bacterium]|nr:phosphate acyltransferase PlsX [Bacteroidales bacterium]